MLLRAYFKASVDTHFERGLAAELHCGAASGAGSTAPLSGQKITNLRTYATYCMFAIKMVAAMNTSKIISHKWLNVTRILVVL